MEKIKKFELTSEFIINEMGKKLFRIKALVSFASVKAGDLGGFVEKEENLDQSGDAWVSDNARVYGDARVSDNAWVCGDARVYGDARVSDNARVYGDARVSDNARVYGDAEVSGDARVSDNARVYGYAWVSDNAWVCGDARVSGDARVCDNAWVCGDARVSGDARVCGDARVSDDADYACVKGFGTAHRNTTFFREKDGGVKVSCGCFFGTIKEFRAQVERTREGKIAKEYLMIADLMELHFGKEG